MRGGPRDRLLEAAKRLTYSEGPGIGVDALLKEAQVARRSLYEHFGGKDGLLLEVIRQAATEDAEWMRATLEAGGRDPRKRLLGVFDALDRVVTQPGFRGCRYLGADLGLADAGHPIHQATSAYRRRVRAMVQHELVELGHPWPRRAAEQLQLLIEGVLATGAASTVAHPGRVARALAEAVLDQAG
ncbi:TetR family transcriptional regulator [Prauserella muralis]|uniref:TetR family transcriptional regulator n=1 Tax=Prauserella muralis TaxID=588067 RepID=A0A2V4ARZ4_9PSEU|nr:TetR family transcriptional regulator [Prauserella muralis]